MSLKEVVWVKVEVRLGTLGASTHIAAPCVIEGSKDSSSSVVVVVSGGGNDDDSGERREP